MLRASTYYRIGWGFGLLLFPTLYLSPVQAADPPITPTVKGCYYTASPNFMREGTIGYRLCTSGHQLKGVNVLAAPQAATGTNQPTPSNTLPGCYYTATPSTLAEGSIGYVLCDQQHNLVLH